jgi:uncharacterized membrane protein YdbT with pleckstrin-like domain
MICPFCGATNKETEPQFCSSCGKSLANAGPRAAAPGTGIVAPGKEEVFFEGRPAALNGMVPLLITILTAGLAFLFFYWPRTWGSRFKITSQRVVVERGLFSKRMDQIDLYRVVDFAVEKSFGQRLMGTGTIILEAMDKTTPELRIEGIRANVDGLYERMRAAAEVEKQKKGVRLMDVERP